MNYIIIKNNIAYIVFSILCYVCFINRQPLNIDLIITTIIIVCIIIEVNWNEDKISAFYLLLFECYS
jgi:hypothetical protein